jgi:hypothetical protein
MDEGHAATLLDLLKSAEVFQFNVAAYGYYRRTCRKIKKSSMIAGLSQNNVTMSLKKRPKIPIWYLASE